MFHMNRNNYDFNELVFSLLITERSQFFEILGGCVLEVHLLYKSIPSGRDISK